MNFKTKINKLHYNRNAKGLFLDLLEFLSLFYGAAVKFRNFLYDRNILKSVKINAKVISVGNLTTGGAGKTPVAGKIAEYFTGKGVKTVVITGGYGGKLSNKKVNLISDGKKIYYDSISAGDEAFWHAENAPSSVVLTCKNRVKAAKYAVDKFNCEVIILDDGFQHRHICRDIDIVLVDCMLKFGNEKLLPAGPLREGDESFGRIDRLIVVNKGQDNAKAEKYSKILSKMFNRPASVCFVEPDYVYNIISEERLADGESASALCAIGQPESFFEFAEQRFEISEKIAYDDHHIYERSEIERIKGTIITTEKDAVKLTAFKRKDIYAMKLKMSLNLDFLDSE